MARDFSTMDSRRLRALLQSASDADRATIQEILDRRENPSPAEAICEEGDTPAEAIREEGDTPAEAISDAPEGARRLMTHDERNALAERLKVNVGHRCHVVPFDSTEWVSGYIAGVINDQRNNIVLYAIKLDSGKRIVKTVRSSTIRILDEISPAYDARWRSKPTSDRKAVALAEADKMMDNVGKKVEFRRVISEPGGIEKVSEFQGRITGLYYSERQQLWMYRIKVPAPNKNDPNAVRYFRKVSTNPYLMIAEGFDNEGLEINLKKRARYDALMSRLSATPYDRLRLCEQELAEAKEKLAKAEELVKAKEKALAGVKK